MKYFFLLYVATTPYQYYQIPVPQGEDPNVNLIGTNAMQTLYCNVNAFQSFMFMKMAMFPDAKPLGLMFLVLVISLLVMMIH